MRDVFNIELRSLEFLPIGEGAWVYKGLDKAGQSWFIKLLRDDAITVEQITAYLHDSLGLAFVLSPLPESPYGSPASSWNA